MGLPRQEYWSELPFPPPGDLPDPEIELESSVSPALAGRCFFFFFLITSAIYVERLYFQIKPYSLHWGLDVSLREHNSTHNNGNSHGELTSEGCHINGAIKGKQ